MGHLLTLFGDAAVAAPFTPTSISGLVFWLDATDAATLFQDAAGSTPAVADGDPVGRWTDKGSAGSHCTQGTASRRGTLRISGANRDVEFDGTDDYLAGASTLGLSQPFTVYIRTTAHTAGDYLFDHVSGGRALFGYNAAVGGQYGPFAGSGFGSSVVARQAGVWTITFNGASSVLYLAGVSVGSGNVGSNAWAIPQIAMSVTGSQNAACKIRALLAYSGAHDASTRAEVEAYLGGL